MGKNKRRRGRRRMRQRERRREDQAMNAAIKSEAQPQDGSESDVEPSSEGEAEREPGPGAGGAAAGDEVVAHEDADVAHEDEDEVVAHEDEDEVVAHEDEDEVVAHEDEDEDEDEVVAHEDEDEDADADADADADEGPALAGVLAEPADDLSVAEMGEVPAPAAGDGLAEVPRGGFLKGATVGVLVGLPTTALALLTLAATGLIAPEGGFVRLLSLGALFGGLPALLSAGGVGRVAARASASGGLRGALTSAALGGAAAGAGLLLVAAVPAGGLPEEPVAWIWLAVAGLVSGAVWALPIGLWIAANRPER